MAINRSEFDPVPSRTTRHWLLRGTWTVIVVAMVTNWYPWILNDIYQTARNSGLFQLSPWAGAALEAVPVIVYASIVSYVIVIISSKVLEYLRVLLLSQVLQYVDWIHNPRSLKTKIWRILLSILAGTGPHNTYSFQNVLPHQPLPKLNQTLDKYLLIVKELLTEDEYEATKVCVNDFRNNEGPKLHQHLEKRAKEQVSWLADYWVSAAYLSNRKPSGVLTNPAYASMNSQCHDPVARGASVMTYATEYADLNLKGDFPATMLQGFVPICMAMHKMCFSTARKPQEHLDTAAIYRNSTHIIVLRKGHFFKVDMYPKDEDGSRRLLDIYECYDVILDIRKRADAAGEAPGVGVFTSTDRTEWAKNRQDLEKLNKEVLHEVDSALFVLALDDYQTESRSDCFKKIVCGYSKNRWFDKTLTMNVTDDTTHSSFGINMEHSFIDASGITPVSEYIQTHEKYENGTLPPRNKNQMRQIPKAQLLTWDLTGLEDALSRASEHYTKLVNDLECVVMMTPFGKNEMKKWRMSPDGCIQMALQLAYYRIHKETPKTYSPASARLFALGRTETSYPTSSFSRAWVQAMIDPEADNAKRLDLLRKAVKENTRFRLDATVGQGCDRHLLGLFCASRELGMDVPQIFTDKAWQLPFKLSTSQVPVRYAELGIDLKLHCGGFAPSDDNGYGVCYAHMGGDYLSFSLTSWKSSPVTDLDRLCKEIIQSFEDLKQLCSS